MGESSLPIGLAFSDQNPIASWVNHLLGDAEVPPYCGLLRSPGLEVLIVGVDWGCNFFAVPSAGRQVVTNVVVVCKPTC